MGTPPALLMEIYNHSSFLLPQVIAIADYQFFIEKRSDENTTVSTVRLLSEEERVEEIAKMLAGSDITEMAREQARELLKK